MAQKMWMECMHALLLTIGLLNYFWDEKIFGIVQNGAWMHEYMWTKTYFKVEISPWQQNKNKVALVAI